MSLDFPQTVQPAVHSLLEMIKRFPPPATGFPYSRRRGGWMNGRCVRSTEPPGISWSPLRLFWQMGRVYGHKIYLTRWCNTQIKHSFLWTQRKRLHAFLFFSTPVWHMQTGPKLMWWFGFYGNSKCGLILQVWEFFWLRSLFARETAEGWLVHIRSFSTASWATAIMNQLVNGLLIDQLLV